MLPHRLPFSGKDDGGYEWEAIVYALDLWVLIAIAVVTLPQGVALAGIAGLLVVVGFAGADLS